MITKKKTNFFKASSHRDRLSILKRKEFMSILNSLRKGLLWPYKDEASFSLPSVAEGSFSPNVISWLQTMRLTDSLAYTGLRCLPFLGSNMN